MAKAKQAPEATPEPEQTKTKAQAIRDALAVDPNGMPKDIAETRSANGWNVSSNEVSAKLQFPSPTRHTTTRAADATVVGDVTMNLWLGVEFRTDPREMIGGQRNDDGKPLRTARC